MSDPVDLSNLRSMTDGDQELERALFEEFFSSFEDGLSSLQNNTHAEAHETWRKQSHALKGIAVNLGAVKLGDLCKQGQEGFESDAAAKNSLLQQMQSEYALAKQFLLSVA